MAELSRFLGEDLARLIPIMIGVIILTLYGSFRTLRGVLLPLSIVLISTVWTLGIMGFLGIPLTIMSNIVPVVLLAGVTTIIGFLSFAGAQGDSLIAWMEDFDSLFFRAKVSF